MSYLTVSTIAGDQSMTSRVTACVAVEQTAGNPPDGDPNQWAFDHRWAWASTPAWSEAWDSAVAGGNPNPGGDPAVITDAMILTRVQQLSGTTS